MNSHSTLTRTVVKTFTYRLISLCADCLVVYLLTHSWALAATFTGIMVVVSTIVYFAHERAWASILWGKKIGENGNGGS